MTRHLFRAALALVLGAVPALAQNPADAELFTRTEGDVVRAAIRVELEGDWHLYHSELGHPKAIGQPTTVTFYGEGIEWSEVRFPEPVKIDQSNIAGEGAFILAHEHELVLYAAGKLAPGATLDGLEVKIKGLVCEDIQGCIPYRQALETSGPGDDALFAKFPADLLPGAASTAGTLASDEKPPEVAPTASAADSEPKREEQSLLLFLLFAVGGGLFALVMPCTYPMIPITISFFTKQADQRGGTPLSLSLAYGAGIVLIFVLIGVVFGSLIIPFATHPVTNLVIGIAFVYFALVLFGVVNLQPPRFLLNVAGSASTKGGYAGVFLMGATLVVTSFTCTAPFVGSLLSFGATEGGLARVALGMAVFGLTMAVPFVLLSFVPGRLRAMPKSGEWMNTVKVFMGFVEIAAALKFLSNSDLVWDWQILSREVYLLLWGLIFLAAALYLFGVFSRGARPGTRRLVSGAATLLFALYCLWGMSGKKLDFVMTAIAPNYSGGLVGWKWYETGGDWTIVKDDYDAALAQAAREDKLLFVNFTGFT